MSDINLSSKVKEIKDILIEESKKKSIYDPITCVPKHNYNEVFQNCFLGDL